MHRVGRKRAASDMIERTHTKDAPWVMVEANDKYFARVKIMKALIERLEAQLEGKG
jgi:AMP-polyphosphate phosphotransferase